MIPKIPEHVLEELKRFDSSLDLSWNYNLNCFDVIRSPHYSCKYLVMRLLDKDKNYIPPNAKVIIYGSEELGIVGLLDRDIWRKKMPKYWIKELEEAEEAQRLKQKREIREEITNLTKEEKWRIKPKIYYNRTNRV